MSIAPSPSQEDRQHSDGSRHDAPAPRSGPSILQRMTSIMEAFGSRATRLTLEEVASVTGLPRSTAHRLLDQLVALSWLEHCAGGYGLGWRALQLGTAEEGYDEVRASAAPHLQELMLRTGMVVHLGVLMGEHVHYLDKVGGLTAQQVPSRIGGRAPVHTTALGKALLAWLSAEEVDSLVGSRLVRHTSATVADLETLHGELHRIRARHGLAFEHGETYPGITCVAVAVRGADGPVAAVSLVGDRHADLGRLAPLVVETGRAISEDLGSSVDASGRVRPAV